MTPAWLDALQGSGLICPDPVFVIGSPRSGTSALGKALGAHPALWASNETKFLAYLFGDGLIDRVHDIEMARPTVSWLRTHDVDADELIAAVGVGINGLLTSRSGGRRWVDHTPDYTPFAGDLARMFPGARFVHIVRDGRAVVHSMLHFATRFEGDRRAQIAPSLPSYFGDARAAATKWVTSVEAGLRFAAAHPDRCTTVLNERIVADPTAVMAGILDAVGVASSPEPATFLATRRINSSFAPASTPRDERPWRQWPAEWVIAFDAIGGALARDLGYGDHDPVG